MSLPTLCARCGASLTIPSDLAATSLHCQFCGHEQPLADLEARRRVLAELAVAERQREVFAQVGQITKVATIVPLVIGAVTTVVVLIVVGIVVWRTTSAIGNATNVKITLPEVPAIPTPPAVPAPTDPKSTGADRVKVMIADHERAGCRTIKSGNTVDDDLTARGVTIPKGHCFTLVVATGVKGNTLTAQFLRSDGKPAGDALDGKEIDTTFCPPKGGTFDFTIDTRDGMPFTFAELECTPK